MKSKGLALLGRANLNKRSSKTSVLPNIYIIYGLDTMQSGTKGLAGKTVRSFPPFPILHTCVWSVCKWLHIV